jgi:hypothetical protein
MIVVVSSVPFMQTYQLKAPNKMRLAVGRVTPCAPWWVGFAARAERRALPIADDYPL